MCFHPVPQSNELCFQVAEIDSFPEAMNYRAMGDFYFRQFKDPTQSKNLLNLAIDEYVKESELNSDPELLVQIARAYLLSGKLDAAEKAIQKASGKDGATGHVVRKIHETQAIIYHRQGALLKAREALKSALKSGNPWKTAKIHLGLAGLSVELFREKPAFATWLDCIMHLFQGLLLMPFSWPMIFSIRPLFRIYLSLFFSRFHSEEQHLATCRKLYQKYPGLEILPIEMGKIHLKRNQFKEAEFWFNRAIYRNPCRDKGYRYLTNLYRRTQQPQKRILIIQQWLSLNPQNGEIMLALSQALSEQPGEHEEAVRYAKQATLVLQDRLMLANAYVHLGNLYNEVQSLDAAITAYQAALSIHPHSLDIYIQLGTLYHEKQEYLLSQKIFERALDLSPNNSKILCNLGYLAWIQGDIRQAQTYYHQSIALDGTYDIALNNLGVLYLDHIGNLEKAMQLFEQTLFHNPNYALCYYNKGRALSFLGQNIEAAKCFKQAQELNESSQELDNQELTERIKLLFENSEQFHNTD